MPRERYEMLEQMLGGLGLRPTAIIDVRSLNLEAAEQPTPIPTGRADFVEFARDNGYTSRMAHNAWNTVAWTGARQEYNEYPHLAPLRFLDTPRHSAVDLRSIKERLQSNAFTTSGWVKATPRKIGFLRALVDTRIGFESDSHRSES